MRDLQRLESPPPGPRPCDQGAGGRSGLCHGRGYPLNLRIACRSNLKPLYRSDSTFLERLHWEAAVDLVPEDVAERLRDRFRT
jgi:hypothetical protein